MTALIRLSSDQQESILEQALRTGCSLLASWRTVAGWAEAPSRFLPRCAGLWIEHPVQAQPGAEFEEGECLSVRFELARRTYGFSAAVLERCAAPPNGRACNAVRLLAPESVWALQSRAHWRAPVVRALPVTICRAGPAVDNPEGPRRCRARLVDFSAAGLGAVARAPCAHWQPDETVECTFPVDQQFITLPARVRHASVDARRNIRLGLEFARAGSARASQDALQPLARLCAQLTGAARA